MLHCALETGLTGAERAQQGIYIIGPAKHRSHTAYSGSPAGAQCLTPELHIQTAVLQSGMHEWAETAQAAVPCPRPHSRQGHAALYLQAIIVALLHKDSEGSFEAAQEALIAHQQARPHLQAVGDVTAHSNAEGGLGGTARAKTACSRQWSLWPHLQAVCVVPAHSKAGGRLEAKLAGDGLAGCLVDGNVICSTRKADECIVLISLWAGADSALHATWG